MPITPAATPVMMGALLGAGLIGSQTPQLASGVVNGVCKWVKTVTVIAPATGTLGGGQGIAQLVVPPPTLMGPLTQGFAAMQILGPMSPLLIAGLANGLSQVFAQGTVLTTHVAVGVGGGTVKFTPGAPGPILTKGMQEAGMTGDGPVKMGGAIGIALTSVFSALTLPLVVAGSPNIVPGAGVGFGKIV